MNIETWPTEGTHDIPLDAIDVSNRLRDIDLDWAQLLAGMIEDEGLIQPIEVRPVANGRHHYKIVAGGHRYEAHRILGRTTITAQIKQQSELQARMREIDENLGQRGLSAFDRATFMAQRQELYLALHPETAAGMAGAAVRWHAADKLSFASETADRLGISERDIRRQIARYRAIAPDVREKIRRSWIANSGTAMDGLAKLGPSDQRKALGPMLRSENQVRSVTAALDEVAGRLTATHDVDAKQLAKLQDAWSRAGQRARNRFIDWVLTSVDDNMLTSIDAAVSVARENRAGG